MEFELTPLEQMTELEVRGELARLRALIHNPHNDEFLRSVELEAAHQVERWGSSHDEHKTPADWFWTAGWLLGKAVHSTSRDKRLHHMITTAALIMNWYNREAAQTVHAEQEFENGQSQTTTEESCQEDSQENC